MTRYSGVAIGLHWLVALLIFGTFGLGLYMTELPFSPDKLRLYSWHKTIGVSVFLLVLVRLGWRLWRRPPPPPPMARWQRAASHAVHHLLYALMLAVPLSGWLMSSAKGFQTLWFGIVPLPDLLSANESVGDALARTHWILNLALGGLVALHLLAALKHQFIDRDGLLGRMWPGRHGETT